MKIINFVLAFTVFVLSTFAILSYKTNNLAYLTNKSVQYNRNLDTALESALDGIVEAYDGEMYTNEDECIDSFFSSLYSSFGISDNEEAQEMFRAYIPAVVIAENDGFYVRYNSYSNGAIKSVWSIKFPYQGEFDYVDRMGTSKKFIVNYRLDDTVQLIMADGTIFSGPKDKLPDLYKYAGDDIYNVQGTGLLQKAIRNAYLDEDHSGYYEAKKDSAVTDSIITKMNYYANLNNEIAQAYGISYNFHLPLTASSELSRAIKSVSVVALFQGFPYGVGTDDVYSKFAVAGARIAKDNRYYVRKADEDVWYYHTKYCTLYGGAMTGDEFRTKDEAASLGAKACPYCKP